MLVVLVVMCSCLLLLVDVRWCVLLLVVVYCFMFFVWCCLVLFGVAHGSLLLFGYV